MNQHYVRNTVKPLLLITLLSLSSCSLMSGDSKVFNKGGALSKFESTERDIDMGPRRAPKFNPGGPHQDMQVDPFGRPFDPRSGPTPYGAPHSSLLPGSAAQNYEARIAPPPQQNILPDAQLIASQPDDNLPAHTPNDPNLLSIPAFTHSTASIEENITPPPSHAKKKHKSFFLKFKSKPTPKPSIVNEDTHINSPYLAPDYPVQAPWSPPGQPNTPTPSLGAEQSATEFPGEHQDLMKALIEQQPSQQPIAAQAPPQKKQWHHFSFPKRSDVQTEPNSPHHSKAPAPFQEKPKATIRSTPYQEAHRPNSSIQVRRSSFRSMPIQAPTTTIHPSNPRLSKSFFMAINGDDTPTHTNKEPLNTNKPPLPSTLISHINSRNKSKEPPIITTSTVTQKHYKQHQNSSQATLLDVTELPTKTSSPGQDTVSYNKHLPSSLHIDKILEETLQFPPLEPTPYPPALSSLPLTPKAVEQPHAPALTQPQQITPTPVASTKKQQHPDFPQLSTTPPMPAIPDFDHMKDMLAEAERLHQQQRLDFQEPQPLEAATAPSTISNTIAFPWEKEDSAAPVPLIR